ncbi:MAG: GH3 auxin-responsive promoter family protein [Akkermansiaceae bacterium]|nr:GH3 auxin-responsive promoter family protein [Akkermansiaceae bacterium]MCP5544392.1 GH3 auxin-responsive promoter family protein [Akkermansiaceae bacterium]MCP5547462.1 GH3 auxin-responsive promoter family protein [Akkermansiaceae bacterium]
MSLAATLIALKARLGARPFQKALKDPVAAQHRLLRAILERNKDTEYGRAYQFGSIRSLGDYQGNVPVISYEDIRARIDRMTHGEANILTAEQPILFAQTSGTTGDPKYIPVTPTCRKGGGTTVWLHYARTDHPKMFDGKIITIVSPAVEGHTPCGIPFGSTSGMVVRELPGIVQSAYAVPYEVYEVEDYDAKYYTLLRFGLAENITMLGTANPSSVVKLAEMADRLADTLIRDIRDGTLSRDFEIKPELRSKLEPRLRADPARAAQLEQMRSLRGGRLLPADYWPDMAFIGCWKGGTVSAYLDQFPTWYDPDGKGMPPVRDMGYLASEARMSIPVSDHGAGGVLSIHLNVYELVPAEDIDTRPDDPDSWSFLDIGGVEVGKEYYVFITTTGGLYRYDMNDVIEVVDMYQGAPVVEFRRKGRGMTNLTGEKLSVNQLIKAVGSAAKETGLSAPHFKAEPDGDNSRYVFKVEFDEVPPEETARQFLKTVDETISGLNIEWKGKRGSGRLRGPVLQVMKPGWYDRGKQKLVAEGRRLFQAKTILLDSKATYHPEPDETAMEVAPGESHQ